MINCDEAKNTFFEVKKITKTRVEQYFIKNLVRVFRVLLKIKIATSFMCILNTTKLSKICKELSQINCFKGTNHFPLISCDLT